MTKFHDPYSESRATATDQARELLWDNVEQSIWWNQYARYTGDERAREKVKIQHHHFWPALVSLKTSFIPSVIELPPGNIQSVLRYGAGRRLLSIISAGKTFSEIVFPERTQVASEDERTKLDDALMIIYISIPAFFDVLAIASFRATKARGYDEKTSDLFSKKYLKTIGLGELYNRIREFISWHKRVKEQLRHRYAHRIPPFVPSAEYSPQDRKRFEELEAQYSRALSDRRFDDLEAITDEQSSIGTFCNWLYFYEEDARMHLQTTVLNDVLTFQVVALTLLEELLTLPGFRRTET